jgi:AraC family transcriptional regulator
MRLAAGSYLGTTTREVRLGPVTVSYTAYEPMQEQPWHVHEHPTFFIQLVGDHVDGAPEGDRIQTALTTTYHPAREYHRSRIGPEAVHGLNIEAPATWLEAHGIALSDLGNQRILGAPPLQHAALRIFSELFVNDGAPSPEMEELVFSTIEPFVVDGSQSARRGTPFWLGRARERLRSQFTSSITLRDLAEEAGVHPVYFARTFKQTHGRTVGQCIQQLRLQFASKLILTGCPIGVAAAEAGFSDQFHLSRLLKRHYRVSPSQLKSYRATALNGSNRS